MKTAISLPDDLFAAADSLADKMGMSRSELYATAVADFLAKHNAAEVTERLNQLYAVESSGIDADVRRAQRLSVSSERW